MPISQFYRVTAEDLQDPVRAADTLNQIFSRISDRLDELQGLRGDAVVRGQFFIQDPDGNNISGFRSTDP